jgi:hypothetical protein
MTAETKHTKHCIGIENDSKFQAERLKLSESERFVHFGCPKKATDCDCSCHKASPITIFPRIDTHY